MAERPTEKEIEALALRLMADDPKPKNNARFRNAQMLSRIRAAFVLTEYNFSAEQKRCQTLLSRPPKVR